VVGLVSLPEGVLSKILLAEPATTLI